jgi:hypothetical protein
VGGNRSSRRARRALRGAAATLGVLTVPACGNADASAIGVVGSADAIAAVVAWQTTEQEPVVGDGDESKLPVIYVVADAGETIDVGVQAEVAEAMVDWATVRFADDVADTFDPDIEGEPVHDDGSLLVLGPIPDPAPTIELDVVRYTAIDVAVPLNLQIASTATTDSTGADAASVPAAVVIEATQG